MEELFGHYEHPSKTMGYCPMDGLGKPGLSLTPNETAFSQLFRCPLEGLEDLNTASGGS